MAHFAAQEDRDGVRFTWNVWPSSKLEATRSVIPCGCVYSPMKNCTPGPLKYEPVRDRRTGCVLNPWCPVDFQTKQWTCPFSNQRNNFPPHYAQAISETNLPAELIQQYTTVEYELPGKYNGPPIFLCVSFAAGKRVTHKHQIPTLLLSAFSASLCTASPVVEGWNA